MKFFIDTANLAEIEAALKTGWIEGVTTNPSLLAKEPKANFLAHLKKIVDLIGERKLHLSAEVFSRNAAEILAQAKEIKEELNYPALSIKVQVGWDELAVIRSLAQTGISVNCTACMTVSQAVLAAKAGSRYASLFWGRIRDAAPHLILGRRMQAAQKGNEKEAALLDEYYIQSSDLLSSGMASLDDFNPFSVMDRTRRIFDREKFHCEIIAGSMRSVMDVRDSFIAGAHIVTVPPKLFLELPKLAVHYKTDEVVKQFLTDFQSWLK